MRLELRAAERTTIDGMACRSARLNSVVFAVEFEDVRSFAGMQFHPHNPLLAGMVTQIFLPQQLRLRWTKPARRRSGLRPPQTDSNPHALPSSAAGSGAGLYSSQ